jgi:hypothetical protein
MGDETHDNHFFVVSSGCSAHSMPTAPIRFTKKPEKSIAENPFPGKGYWEDRRFRAGPGPRRTP